MANGSKGESDPAGVLAISANGVGVYARSGNGDGVYGETSAADKTAVVGINTAGTGIYGESQSGFGMVAKSNTVGLLAQAPLAARFEGDVEVTGDVRLANADCAEAFDIVDDEAVAPGTVMVMSGAGELAPCEKGYDCCVAGVVSGAGDYRPALLLDQRASSRTRPPIALLGKVACLVDAAYGQVEVGAMLTTSPTRGAAMVADDRERAFGAVIGKALAPHHAGVGLVPILVALQ